MTIPNEHSRPYHEQMEMDARRSEQTERWAGTPSEPFTLPTDEDDLAELASVGIRMNARVPLGYEANPGAVDDVSLDVQIGSVLRQLGRTSADRSRYVRACAAELAQVQRRYDRIMQPLVEREKMLIAIGEHLASQAHFVGKSKSRKTAYGEFGTRAQPERISIENADELLAWAEKDAPQLIQTETIIKKKIPQARVKEFVQSTGELPPGVVQTAAFDKPFLKPLTEIES